MIFTHYASFQTADIDAKWASQIVITATHEREPTERGVSCPGRKERTVTGIFGNGPSPTAESATATTRVLWAQLSPATSPPERSGGAAAYDPCIDQVLVFRGQACSSTYEPPIVSVPRLAAGLHAGNTLVGHRVKCPPPRLMATSRFWAPR